MRPRGSQINASIKRALRSKSSDDTLKDSQWYISESNETEETPDTESRSHFYLKGDSDTSSTPKANVFRSDSDPTCGGRCAEATNGPRERAGSEFEVIEKDDPLLKKSTHDSEFEFVDDDGDVLPRLRSQRMTLPDSLQRTTRESLMHRRRQQTLAGVEVKESYSNVRKSGEVPRTPSPATQEEPVGMPDRVSPQHVTAETNSSLRLRSNAVNDLPELEPRSSSSVSAESQSVPSGLGARTSSMASKLSASSLDSSRSLPLTQSLPRAYSDLRLKTSGSDLLFAAKPGVSGMFLFVAWIAYPFTRL